MSGQRSIFEEVSGSKTDAAPKPVPQESRPDGDRAGIARWMLALFVLVVVMILVGGLTRLTDSGLSITEWAPITGAIPPFSEAAWLAEFEKYKAIPEFQLVNSAMTLAEFKYIYWWEWGHRQLGRLIGLVWAAGFLWFYLRKEIPRGWVPRMLLLGALGGLQGFIGWWMVSSGLEGDRVDVASYRLATHLGLAFVILGFIAWYLFMIRRADTEILTARRAREAALVPVANILLAATFLQIVLGALVAGLDAGRGYVDWPLMGGEVFPSDSFNLSPGWSNFFENEALTQFNHRLIGYALLGLAIWAFMKARSSGLVAVRNNFKWALIFISVQAVIGIITVLNAAPLWLGITHQFGAILVWVIVMRTRFEVYYPGTQSLRS